MCEVLRSSDIVCCLDKELFDRFYGDEVILVNLHGHVRFAHLQFPYACNLTK